jgi:formylglycine-generating enzyme required for sulfatase activity
MMFDASEQLDPEIPEFLYECLLQLVVDSGKYTVVDASAFASALASVSEAQPDLSAPEARRQAMERLGVRKLYVGSVKKLGKRLRVSVKVFGLDQTVLKVKRVAADSEESLDDAIASIAPELIFSGEELEEQRRVAYLAALAKLKAAREKARSVFSIELWQSVRQLAECAMATGHSDVSEAAELLREADESLAGWTSATRRVLVATPHGQEAKLITYYRNDVGMEFVRIPAGSFVMGSPPDEYGRDADEGPQHEVRFAGSFLMSAYETTQAQYSSVMNTDPAHFPDPDGPAEMVSWNDAAEFCGKLSLKATFRYRLPTEAEWEYACRAGSATAFYYGAARDGLGDFGWYDTNSGRKPHRPGLKLPNAWGLYDMHGNVWESPPRLLWVPCGLRSQGVIAANRASGALCRAR